MSGLFKFLLRLRRGCDQPARPSGRVRVAIGQVHVDPLIPWVGPALSSGTSAKTLGDSSPARGPCVHQEKAVTLDRFPVQEYLGEHSRSSACAVPVPGPLPRNAHSSALTSVRSSLTVPFSAVLSPVVLGDTFVISVSVGQESRHSLVGSYGACGQGVGRTLVSAEAQLGDALSSPQSLPPGSPNRQSLPGEGREPARVLS